MINIKIEELKEKIINNDIDDQALIFIYSDNNFLCKQYANEIAKNRKLNISRIDDLNVAANDDAFFDMQVSDLYIYEVDKLNQRIDDTLKNIIIICKEVRDDVATNIECIEFPKLAKWQIEDYVKMRLPGLSEIQSKWLCEITSYNIFRIDQECKKIELFPEGAQKDLFDQLNLDNAYCDLNTYSIYEFTNAIMKKDYNTVVNILKELDYVDIEGTGLITIFKKQLKALIKIKANPYASAESLGISTGQYSALKFGCLKLYTEKQLIFMYRFITSLYKDLMAGRYTFDSNNRINNKKFVHYITLNLIQLGKVR